MDNNQEKNKKKFYKRWWFWVLIAVVIIIIASAGGNNKPKKVGENGSSNPVASASQSASAPKAAPQVFKVGDHVKLGDSIITVNKVEYSQGSEYDKPNAGDEFADLNVTIQNTGSSQQYISTLSQMFLRDSDGNSYQIAVTDKAMSNASASLDGAVIANSKRTGWVGFEIPKTATGLQFQYNSGLLSNDSALIDLGR